MSRFERFLATRDPWRLGTLYFRTQMRLTRLGRRLRYGAMPRGGWGEGWRVLVFRLWRQGEQPRELHVLAPVSGEAFDWERLKRLVRGEIRPVFAHEAGVLTGEMRWKGNHLGVAIEEFDTQRIPMDPLIPGMYRGGVVDVCLVLLDVRPAEGVEDGEVQATAPGPTPPRSRSPR